ncbi:hypothetical protein [Georgenia sp. SUBG003]|uniref:hypothetical protein n=1 Tax=Georgenia sp. SUBG003 TaxID=1497974 RepID=UPI003AB81B59
MPRKGPAPKRPLVVDPVYGSPVVTQLVNRVLQDGKKSTAERIAWRTKILRAGLLGHEGVAESRHGPRLAPGARAARGDDGGARGTRSTADAPVAETRSTA